MAKKKTVSRETERKAIPKHKPTDHARNYCQVAYEFALEAARDVKGKKHCRWVQLAAKRHLEDLKRKGWAYWFSEWHGNDVCDFIEKLPHVEGKWETLTIRLEPPQIFILVNIFGWRRGDYRRFSSTYIEMARKGAKSTVTSGVALYCLTCEDEPGPQVIIGATTSEQAGKVFNPAKNMVKQTPDLREAFGLTAWSRSITCEDSGGYIQTINSKASTQDGWNPHVGILDELHAHKDRGLYDVIRSAFGSRRNPLMWCITTAGYILDGVCYEQRTLVTKILEGFVEADHYFGIIFTLDLERDGDPTKGDDPLDPRVWVKANPMLGITPTLESMESFAKEAIASPDSMGEFQTKRLNIWTSAKGGWINTISWKKCNGPIDILKLRSVPAYGGLDLASVSDITAWVIAWILDDWLYCRCRFYLPEDTVEPRTKKANLPYQQWVKAGYLTVTPGNITDYDFVKRDIKEDMSAFNIKEIGYDSWNATQTANDLINDGAPLVEMIQGPKTFHPAMQELERRIKSGRFSHGDNPVLSWMASNIVARRDANRNMAPDKKNSQEKIDGIVSLLMALGRAILHVEKRSKYETEGLIVV